MSKFKQIAKEQYISHLLKEFINSNHKQNRLLSESYVGVNPKSNLYYAIQLGEKTAKQVQSDILNEYLNEHPVLKEDIFQRGLAKAKAYLTTPLGKGFGQAKDTQVIQNLFGALKKNTEKIVNAGASPFAPSAEDVKNSPTQIGQVGALIGKRFAALQNNPKLNIPATPAEQQAGMGKIEQLIAKLRSTGLVKGADNVLDEIGIFARQHPVLTNMIVAGLVAVLTLSGGGGLFGIPLLGKFLTGTALRTLIGMLKGEKATQAATKAAAVSGAGIAIGKLLGLFYDKLAGWIGGQADGSALPVPPKPIPQPIDRGSVINPNAQSPESLSIPNAPDNSVPPIDRGSVINPNAQSPESLGIPNAPDNSVPPGIAQPGAAGVGQQPSVTGVNIPPTLATLRPKLDTLARLASSTDVKGATAPAARQAVQNWVAGISQPEAQTMLADPNATNQLMRKGALGLLKQKFGIKESKKSELDSLKEELKSGVQDQFNEANPLTAAKNFMFGGPEVGGKNSRLDFKQVESDYLKFLNNMESSLSLKSEKDILDTLRKYDKTFPGIYDYVKKVRDWLYGATPESDKPTPDPVVVPPNEEPKQPVIDPNAPPQQPVPGAPGADGGFKMDATQLKNIKLFLSKLIELGNVTSKSNPQNLDKATLRNLALITLTIGDILVNKKGVGKSNPSIDQALQGIDILGQLPQATAPSKPVSGVFAESDGGTYKNQEISKYLGNLKSAKLFQGLQPRLIKLMKTNPNDRNSIIALRSFLTGINNIMIKSSAQIRQKLGNPSVVQKELQNDKEFMKEATSTEIIQFNNDLNVVIPNIIGLMSAIRQAFNRKNPNSIYNQDAKPAQPASNNKPDEKSKVPFVPYTDARLGKGGEDDARMEESKYNLNDYRKFF